jgi:hypothetical protein
LITKVTSTHSYVVKSFLGDDFEVHPIRLLLYEGNDYKPEEEVKELFLRNRAAFEIEKKQARYGYHPLDAR